VFLPLSLLSPAIGLPGLPAVSRAFADSPLKARNLAGRLSAAITVLTVVYCAIVWPFRTLVLESFFGESFAGYSDLVFPTALAAALTAMPLGYLILLRAGAQGRVLVKRDAALAFVGLTSMWTLAATMGTIGIPWGFALTGVVGVLTLIPSITSVEKWSVPMRPLELQTEIPA
ncbi:MAG: hypothetical protein ACRD1T_22595, partial [Acidimicrobiia bacterium]